MTGRKYVRLYQINDETNRLQENVGSRCKVNLCWEHTFMEMEIEMQRKTFYRMCIKRLCQSETDVL